MAEIRGNSIALPQGGSVYVGRSDGEPGRFLSFTNTDGDITRIRLSSEASDALQKLLPLVGGDESPPAQFEWRLVVSDPSGERL